ncbi:aldo/keto reductase [Clostridia bacterium]|nr:aldo/keto reductase [Clostridia bacterium]
MYVPNENRYDHFSYRRVGSSGLKLPPLSLGLWHNFGYYDNFETAREMIHTAFDLGITHFDLANNYGNPANGSAETNFGRILKEDFPGNLRDELIISTKAGFDMWPGPYGGSDDNGGSRKYILASLDQSLTRLGLNYADIFYSHRPVPGTPIEETVGALATAIHQGKALYVGISSYTPEQTQAAANEAVRQGIRILIHQPNYNMFDRWIEEGLQAVLDQNGIGSIAFVPLAQGLLTDRYLNGIPADSRAAKAHQFLEAGSVTDEKIKQIQALGEIAEKRGQSLAQMAIAWVLRENTTGGVKPVTSALIGASRPEQIRENVAALDHLEFSNEELAAIDQILLWDKNLGNNPWHALALRSD